MADYLFYTIGSTFNVMIDIKCTVLNGMASLLHQSSIHGLIDQRSIGYFNHCV